MSLFDHPGERLNTKTEGGKQLTFTGLDGDDITYNPSVPGEGDTRPISFIRSNSKNCKLVKTVGKSENYRDSNYCTKNKELKVVQKIAENVSSSEFTSTLIIVTIIVPICVPERQVRYKPTFSVFVPGTKTGIIIVTINVKINSEVDTFSYICCMQI